MYPKLQMPTGQNTFILTVQQSRELYTSVNGLTYGIPVFISGQTTIPSALASMEATSLPPLHSTSAIQPSHADTNSICQVTPTATERNSNDISLALHLSLDLRPQPPLLLSSFISQPPYIILPVARSEIQALTVSSNAILISFFSTACVHVCVWVCV